MAVVDETIVQSSDDAEEHGTGAAVTLDGAEIRLTTADYWGGWRFTGINIGAGATIDLAKMEWYIPNVGDDYFTGKVIYCQDANNPGTFTTANGNITGRARTVASYTLVSGRQTPPDWYDVPADYPVHDLAALIQEVVDNNGGTGDALVFIVESITTNDLDIQAWDWDDHSRAAKLHIEYTPGNGVARIPRPPAVSGVPSAHF